MLPGLMPAHTRSSYHSASHPESSGSRLHLEKLITNPDDFIISPETGLWLLPPSVAERDIAQDITHAAWRASELKREGDAKEYRLKYERMLRILERSKVDAFGCVTGGLRGKQTPMDTVIDVAEFEMRGPTHATSDEVPHLSMCGNDGCYNARHFHLDFARLGQGQRRFELNPTWYKALDDGAIETIWGDILPPVEDSLRYFISFQRSFFPFVPYNASKLTPTPISQISFHPLTGCWESYMYEKNSEGLANPKNGYGVMYARKGPDEVDTSTGELRPGYRRGSVLAHNLIWTASGRTLWSSMERNHLCNYPRCCNPLHIEQIDPDANRSHGHAARAKIRELEKVDPSSKTAALSKAELAALYIPLRERYAELVTEAQLHENAA